MATIVQNVFIRGQFNNYLIFDGVFWHTLKQLPLYVAYPEEYFDTNHYGPFFSLIIAPFAILPKWVGCSFWIMANAAFLYWAIRQLPLPKSAIIGVLLIAAHDMYTAAAMQQFQYKHYCSFSRCFCVYTAWEEPLGNLIYSNRATH